MFIRLKTANVPEIKEIAYNCGNDSIKRSFNYFRRAEYYGKTICFLLKEDNQNIGFYFVSISKDHWRWIAIAVKTEFAGKGYGRKLLTHLLTQAKGKKLTFKTDNEKSLKWLLKQGAKIKEIKENGDVEMWM